jgi:transposase-like protein
MMSTVANRSGTLEPKQRQAVELIVGGYDMHEVAERVGIGRTTLWRWRSIPAFAAALARADDEARRSQLRILNNGAKAATLFLAGVLRDGRTPVDVKVKAASALLARWASLQPSEVDVSMSVGAHVTYETDDDGSAVDRLRKVLNDIREREEAAVAAGVPRRLAIEAQSTLGNGHGNGSGNGHHTNGEDA